MGSFMNFKNFGEIQQNQVQGISLKPEDGTPLVRQSSVYSLTFDEFQNTLGGSGKDFGSMNMDELLKSIWSAEETQGIPSMTVVGQGSSDFPGGNLRRQGSITLPRTLSQKTVDDVWRELFKENSGFEEANNPAPGPNLQQQQRQPTLGLTTLEEFLFRAGVVREEGQQMATPNNNGFYGGVTTQSNDNSTGLTIGFQQPAQNNIGINGQINSQIFDNNNMVPNHPSSMPMNMNGMRSSQQQQQPPSPQPLFPKQATLNFTSPIPMTNNTMLASPGRRGALVGISDPSINKGLYQGGQLGMGGLVSPKMGATMGSPANHLSPDMTAINNGETSSVSPSPYMINGSARGRKSGTLEKAMERRHRRMIKNRESAARSRSRKQAYTLELEAEVEKLKEMNNELRKKQDELMEMQKNQVMEKRRCLRRTQTGPW